MPTLEMEALRGREANTLPETRASIYRTRVQTQAAQLQSSHFPPRLFQPLLGKALPRYLQHRFRSLPCREAPGSSLPKPELLQLEAGQRGS